MLYGPEETPPRQIPERTEAEDIAGINRKCLGCMTVWRCVARVNAEEELLDIAQYRAFEALEAIDNKKELGLNPDEVGELALQVDVYSKGIVRAAKLIMRTQDNMISRTIECDGPHKSESTGRQICGLPANDRYRVDI